jgi:hypothetical protein
MGSGNNIDTYSAVTVKSQPQSELGLEPPQLQYQSQSQSQSTSSSTASTTPAPASAASTISTPTPIPAHHSPTPNPAPNTIPKPDPNADTDALTPTPSSSATTPSSNTSYVFSSTPRRRPSHPANYSTRLSADGTASLSNQWSSFKDEPQLSPTATATATATANSTIYAPRAGANAQSKDRRMSDLANYRRELAVLETSRVPQIQQIPPTGGASPQIAPWANQPGSPANTFTMPTTFFNESTDNLSLASQLSPGHQISNRQQHQHQHQHPSQHDAPDASYFDGRRPSAASILSASSQGSKTSIRGGFRKLQGFFGEEFPGRDSSDGSLPTSLAGKDQRGRSYSHSRPTHRDRNYSNATDHTRDVSPSSSRPRTPVPAPEVVPFLYQDNSVCTTPRFCLIALTTSFCFRQSGSVIDTFLFEFLPWIALTARFSAQLPCYSIFLFIALPMLLGLLTRTPPL